MINKKLIIFFNKVIKYREIVDNDLRIILKNNLILTIERENKFIKQQVQECFRLNNHACERNIFSSQETEKYCIRIYSTTIMV